MATRPTFKQTNSRIQLDVFLGKAEKPLGRLIFIKNGPREFSQFEYSDEWLIDPHFFDISPDLQRQRGFSCAKRRARETPAPFWP